MSTFRLSCVLAAALGASAALAEPESFETSEAAVAAVVEALKAHDREALLAVFGPENEDVIISGNDERDREDRDDFIAAYDQMHRVAVDEDGVATLYVGRDQWPFPIRLARERCRLGVRRRGRARRNAGPADRAQRARRHRPDARLCPRAVPLPPVGLRRGRHHGVRADRFLSSAGKRDGLYWPPELGEPASPVGDVVAEAAAEGYVVRGVDEPPKPYLGYYFQILDAQGTNAPGGAMDYMVNGNMVAGHALLAFPADYGETGIMSFMVGENGIVYEADLGENTIELASDIESFDPVPPWSPVDEE